MKLAFLKMIWPNLRKDLSNKFFCIVRVHIKIQVSNRLFIQGFPGHDDFELLKLTKHPLHSLLISDLFSKKSIRYIQSHYWMICFHMCFSFQRKCFFIKTTWFSNQEAVLLFFVSCSYHLHMFHHFSHLHCRLIKSILNLFIIIEKMSDSFETEETYISKWKAFKQNNYFQSTELNYLWFLDPSKILRLSAPPCAPCEF